MSFLSSHVTFGVEIECILGYEGAKKSQRMGILSDLRPRIHQAITNAGVPCEDPALPDRAKPPKYTQWSITTDPTIRPSRQQIQAVIHAGNVPVQNEEWLMKNSIQCQINAREVITRKYWISELRNGQFTRDLSAVLTALHTVPWYIGTTRRCGLHVHVGLPLQNPVLAPHCLAALRRLAVLSIVCEIPMEGIAARDVETEYAKAVGQTQFDFTMRADMDVCNYVLRCRTVWDLQQVMLAWPQDYVRFKRQRVKGDPAALTSVDWVTKGERYFRMAFQPSESQIPRRRRPANKPPGTMHGHGTVEFRVHRGSVERGCIEMWTRVCVGMVSTCAGMNDTEFRVRLMQEGGRRMTMRRFLECFVRDSEATRYYLRKGRVLPGGPVPGDTSDRDL